MVIMDCVVYGLRKKETETILYVGSSKVFKERKQGHKGKCFNPKYKEYNYPIYNHIRENGGWEVFEFIILETIEDVLTKRIREQFWINKYGINNLLNTYNAYITEEENDERMKAYNLKHKKEILKKKKEHYELKKEEILKQCKTYREEHKEEIAERAKANRIKNAEKIRAFKSRKVMCDCGIIYTHSHKARHYRTKRHLSFYDN